MPWHAMEQLLKIFERFVKVLAYLAAAVACFMLHRRCLAAQISVSALAQQLSHVCLMLGSVVVELFRSPHWLLMSGQAVYGRDTLKFFLGWQGMVISTCQPCRSLLDFFLYHAKCYHKFKVV